MYWKSARKIELFVNLRGIRGGLLLLLLFDLWSIQICNIVCNLLFSTDISHLNVSHFEN